MANQTRATGINAGPSRGPGGVQFAFPDVPNAGPSGGPAGTGPTGSPGGTPGPGSTGPGGGPSGSNGSSGGTTTANGSSNGGYYVDPGFNAAIAGSFLDILKTATSPDALEAQNILLRRIALEGDVTGSRVPPPRNITEIGGYLNLLTTLNQYEMRAQTLAGILGVAGPNPPLGWISNANPPLTFTTLPNDRPAGPAQSSIPLTVPIRSDFATAFQAAQTALHAQGCALPIAALPRTLPTASVPGAPSAADPLPYLGRALDIVAGTALVDPTNDPIALIRKSGTTDPFQIAARVLSTGSVPVPVGNYDAVQCTSSNSTIVALASASFVLIAPILGNAGFYPASPLPVPATLSDTAWTRFTNVTGLVKGVTKLSDELSLLYDWNSIEASVFGGMIEFVWDGTQFSPS